MQLLIVFQKNAANISRMEILEHDITPLARIALKVGDVICEMQDDIVLNKNWEEKEDGSPFCPADQKAHDLACEALQKEFPGIPIVSEENSDEENEEALQANERFEIDPLDNTSGYIKNYGGYSINIGRVRNGQPIDGAVYFPSKHELFFSKNGKAYVQSGHEVPRVIHATKGLLNRQIVAAVGINEQAVEHLGKRKFEMLQYPGQMRTCRVAMGKCDITGINSGANGGFKTWDTVAPHAVLLAAGGDIITRDGKIIRYNTGTTYVPEHIAGSRDAFITLDLMDIPGIIAQQACQMVDFFDYNKHSAGAPASAYDAPPDDEPTPPHKSNISEF